MRTICVLPVLALAIGCGKQNVATPLATQTAQTDDQDRAAFIAFVKKYAQTPADLEVLEFGKRNDQKGFYSRTFVIRCKLIDYTPSVVNQPQSDGSFRQIPIATRPVTRDSGTANFKTDGTIAAVNLHECAKSWTD